MNEFATPGGACCVRWWVRWGAKGCIYHWTFLRRGLRAPSPSIILCVKKGTSFVPQRRGYSHSGEGKNGLVRHFTVERRGYEKIPVVEFKDGYKTDLQNSFRVNRIILRGVLTLVTQILSRIWWFSLKVPGGILGFVPTSPGLETPLLRMHGSYVLVSNRVRPGELNLLLFDLSACLWPELRAIKVGSISFNPGYTSLSTQPCGQILSDLHDFDIYG